MNDRANDYVFISYSHADNIEKYLDYFDHLNFNVVYDETLSFGEEWDLNVRRFINNNCCKGVICLLSRSSIKSRAVLQELDYTRIYNKPCFAISLENASIDEILSSIENSDDLTVANFIAEYFPPKKLFLKANELEDRASQVTNTFSEWGLFPTEPSGPTDIERYSSNQEGEKERLDTQQQGYVDLDMEVLTESLQSFERNNLVIVDLGCSSGDVTYSRFSKFDNVSKVIGIDYNPNDIADANEKYGNEKFSFFVMDLDDENIIPDIQKLLEEMDVEKIDLVFSALTLHHLKNPSLLLLKLYEILSDDGILVIRGADDGSKMCHPGGELMSEFLLRYNKLINSVSDRYFGRKMFKLLYDAGYVNIRMRYSVSDTCEKSRLQKELMYKVGFSYRVKRLDELEKRNLNNQKLLKEIAWQKDALGKIKALFSQRDFWYSNTTYIAIARVQ